MILIEAFGYSRETGKKYENKVALPEETYEKIKRNLYSGNFYFKENDKAIDTYVTAREVGIVDEIVSQSEGKFHKYLEKLIAEVSLHEN